MRTVTISHITLTTMILIMSGCSQGPSTHEVEGKVMLNGQPLDRVEVIFIPDEKAGTVGPRSTAITDENGCYRLMTEDGKATGAVAGKHRIIFNDLKAIIPIQNRPAMGGRTGNGNPGQERPGHGPPGRGQPRPGQEANAVPLTEIKAPPSRIPYAFRELSTTPMQKEVQPGKQTIDLELTGR